MKVAILEDDPDQAALVADVLRRAGHLCDLFASGRALITKLRQETFDLLLLDWSVLHISGVEVAAWARKHLTPPPAMMMITARGDAQDIVAGLEAGADDFVVKPIDPAVLSARVSALLRRTYPNVVVTQTETYGPFSLDPIRLCVSRGEVNVQLTAKEFALALAFFRNLHRPLGRTYLLETVWGRNPNLLTRTLDAHVSRVRNKLDLRPETGFKLASVYSYGYRLESILEGFDS